jgi:hypothetical protein
MTIFYVNQNATGENDGTSWTNAYSDLQNALAVATANDEIWVADGTYKPTNDGDRDASFYIPSGVKVYGGFAGGETSREQRDWINNETILSGNIGSETIQTDNSYHVVDISETTNTTILDGFSISEGNANGGNTGERDSGGGIYGWNGANATLKNLVITDNLSVDRGGGFYLNGGSPNLINVTFRDNFANFRGGALYLRNNSSPKIENSLFIGNESQSGGAIGIDSNISGTEIINSTFYNNQANHGGAIANFTYVNSGNFNNGDIENSIFFNNSGSDNQIVSGERRGSVTINNSIVEGGYDGNGTNIIDVAPLFFDAENNDLRLRRNSPGVDVGNNNVVDETTDLVNNPRVFNDTVDIGAYEYGVFMHIDDVTLVEGNSNTTNAVFIVTLLDSLGKASAEEVSVNYATVDNTATAGEDYTTTEGTLVFSVGETTKTINVPLVGDRLIENNEEFLLELNGLTGNAVIIDERATATITNDDLPREISIDDATIEEGNEGERAIAFTIFLNESYIENITVDYSLLENTAIPGDYIDLDGMVTFEPGETEKTISVIVPGDEEIEADETFFVQLSNPNHNAVIIDERATATITNDDLPREISISDAAIDEGNEGEKPIEFTISLNETYVEDITVDYNVVENTATADEDYKDIEGTVTFAPGEKEKTISVQAQGDTTFEGDETFFLQLSNSSDNATITDDRAIGTITNNDEEPEPVPEPIPLTQTIKRFQNSDIPGTYIFAGEDESTNIRDNFANFDEEGTAFKVSFESGDDLIPLYRFQSTRNPGTYLFVGEEERQGILENFSNDFNEEGLAFYVYGVGEEKGTTFYRFQNEDKPGTYLFAGPEERENIIDNFPNFTEEGPAFEVGI